MIEDKIIEFFKKNNIDLIIAVPCKYTASLLVKLEEDIYFTVIYPQREEEGVGIYAGAYLAGRKAVMIIQNSGLGNMVNAIMSLINFYKIPLFLLISERGRRGEKVAAQRPMGDITDNLLGIMKVVPYFLDDKEDIDDVFKYIQEKLFKQTRVIIWSNIKQ